VGEAATISLQHGLQRPGIRCQDSHKFVIGRADFSKNLRDTSFDKDLSKLECRKLRFVGGVRRMGWGGGDTTGRLLFNMTNVVEDRKLFSEDFIQSCRHRRRQRCATSRYR
jgi:hypothetical protein